MDTTKGLSFLQGLTAGAFGSFIGASALLYIMSRGELVSFSAGHLPSVGHWFDWAYTNLGSSIPVFAILLAAFFFSLGARTAIRNRPRRVAGSERTGTAARS